MLRSKLVDVGVDYLTLTSRESTRYLEWKEAFNFCAAEEQARGNKWHDARLLGYEGEQCGHVFIGKRTDGYMARLSSGAADHYGLLFSPDACHCTRIDLQVTLEFEWPQPEMLRKAYEFAKVQPVKNGRPPLYTRLENSLGGGTLYVGSRSSMRYGRIYDKGVEELSQVAGKTYRWELEVKDTLADQAVAMLTGGGENQRQILGILGDFFSTRALPVHWNIPSMEEHFEIPRVTIEDAGSLRWLAGPVAKTFARLAATVGFEEALRAVLASCCNETTDTAIIHTMAEIFTENSQSVGELR